MAAIGRRKRGGARPRSGPKPKPPWRVRRNRVVVMLTDEEFGKLKRIADVNDLSLGTAAYRFVAKSLQVSRTHRTARRVAR